MNHTDRVLQELFSLNCKWPLATDISILKNFLLGAPGKRRYDCEQGRSDEGGAPETQNGCFRPSWITAECFAATEKPDFPLDENSDQSHGKIICDVISNWEI